MKTRLEQQIEKMQNELNATISFANEKNKIFLSDFNSKISPLLLKYKIKVQDPYNNTFVDKSFLSDDMIYRVFLKSDFSMLSDKQKKNIESKLRELGVPMPIAPISNISITLAYV